VSCRFQWERNSHKGGEEADKRGEDSGALYKEGAFPGEGWKGYSKILNRNTTTHQGKKVGGGERREGKGDRPKKKKVCRT